MVNQVNDELIDLKIEPIKIQFLKTKIQIKESISLKKSLTSVNNKRVKHSKY